LGSVAAARIISVSTAQIPLWNQSCCTWMASIENSRTDRSNFSRTVGFSARR